MSQAERTPNFYPIVCVIVKMTSFTKMHNLYISIVELHYESLWHYRSTLANQQLAVCKKKTTIVAKTVTIPNMNNKCRIVVMYTSFTESV